MPGDPFGGIFTIFQVSNLVTYSATLALPNPSLFPQLSIWVTNILSFLLRQVQLILSRCLLQFQKIYLRRSSQSVCGCQSHVCSCYEHFHWLCHTWFCRGCHLNPPLQNLTMNQRLFLAGYLFYISPTSLPNEQVKLMKNLPGWKTLLS